MQRFFKRGENKSVRSKTSKLFIRRPLALLAIFDTQVLSVFRRQREIRTYVALGMTRKQVVGIFTVEGAMYSISAAVVAVIIGVPLFIWLANIGVSMGVNADQDFGLVIAERIFPAFGAGLVRHKEILRLIQHQNSSAPYPQIQY
jgi:putative ABC transport system permease protein